MAVLQSSRAAFIFFSPPERLGEIRMTKPFASRLAIACALVSVFSFILTKCGSL